MTSTISMLILLPPSLLPLLHHCFFNRKRLGTNTNNGSTEKQREQLPLPPGTMGYPYIDETFQLYSNNPNAFFAQKQANYGPIFKTHILVLGCPCIMVSMKSRRQLGQIVATFMASRRSQGTAYIIGVIFAARDTTASVLTWIVKYLAENPSVLKAVTEEHEAIMKLKETMSDEEKALTWADTRRMPFTSMVIQETMRVASILSFTFREAVEDVEYGGYLLIPKGWKVLPLFRNIHHSADNFPDPEKFDPSRFEVAPKPNTFMPFGIGTHSCPGNELAKLEILVIQYSSMAWNTAPVSIPASSSYGGGGSSCIWAMLRALHHCFFIVYSTCLLDRGHNAAAFSTVAAVHDEDRGGEGGGSRIWPTNIPDHEEEDETTQHLDSLFKIEGFKFAAWIAGFYAALSSTANSSTCGTSILFIAGMSWTSAIICLIYNYKRVRMYCSLRILNTMSIGSFLLLLVAMLVFHFRHQKIPG